MKQNRTQLTSNYHKETTNREHNYNNYQSGIKVYWVELNTGRAQHHGGDIFGLNNKQKRAQKFKRKTGSEKNK